MGSGKLVCNRMRCGIIGCSTHSPATHRRAIVFSISDDTDPFGAARLALWAYVLGPDSSYL